MNLSRTLRIALVSSSLSLSAFAALSNEEFAALRSRAEAGDPIAQHNLGLVFADAKDPHFNLVESYAWLKAAANNGAGGNALAVVKGQLSAAQVNQAEARAVELAKLIAQEPGPGPAFGGGATLPPALEPAAATAEFKKYSEELAAAWKENEQLKLEVGKLRAAAANFEGERNGLLAKLSTASAAPVASAEIDGLRTQLATAKADLTASAEAAAKEKATLTAALRQATESAKSREAAMQTELTTAIAAASTPNDAAKAALAQADEAQIKLESALRSLELQKQETDRVQKALVAVEAERVALADQVAEAKRVIAAPAQGTSSVEAAELKLQVASAESKVRQLERERDELQQRLASASGPSAQVVAFTPPTEGGTESGELAEVKDKLAVALRSFQIQRNEIDDLRAKLAQLEVDKAAVEGRLSESTDKAASAEARASSLESLRSELALTREQLRHTQNQLTAEVNERLRTREQAAVAPRASGGPLLFAPLRPSPAPVAPTPAPTPEPREYTVRPGDTLSKIARRMLGDADRWPELIEANRDVVTNPSALPVGVKLRIP